VANSGHRNGVPRVSNATSKTLPLSTTRPHSKTEVSMFGKRVAVVVVCLAAVHLCVAQNSSSYVVSVDGISVTDVSTGVSDIVAIHNDRLFDVVANLAWEADFYDVASSNQISWEMSVNDVVKATGVFDLVEVRSLTVDNVALNRRAYQSSHHRLLC